MSAAVAFGPTANPDTYVPWSGSERALARLVRWALAERTPVCLLSGPPGMGKTLILKLLAARTGSALRSLPVAYPDCDPATLSAFLRHQLAGTGALDPHGELLEALPAAGSPAVLVIVDEGDLFPNESARFLQDLANKAEGRLRVVIGVTRDERRAELEALFGAAAVTIPIEGTMSKAEVAAYVRTQLARANFDASIAARFDASTLTGLHEKSAGVPAALQSLAAALLFEAQRKRGEFRLPAAPAAEAPRAVPDEARVETTEREIDLSAATPPARRSRRPSPFALGITLGVVGGIAVAQLAPRMLATRGDSNAPVESDAALALPAVAAPAPALVAAVNASAPPVAVSFNADPWARIEVDGQLVGVTPIAAHPVAPGRRRVAAHLADGRVVEREIEIGESANRHIVFP